MDNNPSLKAYTAQELYQKDLDKRRTWLAQQNYNLIIKAKVRSILDNGAKLKRRAWPQWEESNAQTWKDYDVVIDTKNEIILIENLFLLQKKQQAFNENKLTLKEAKKPLQRYTDKFEFKPTRVTGTKRSGLIHADFV